MFATVVAKLAPFILSLACDLNLVNVFILVTPNNDSQQREGQKESGHDSE